MMELASLVVRDNVSGDCTKETCPASDSIYGYAPNKAASIFFVAIFFLCALAFMVQTVLYRRWLAFSIVLTLGCALEGVGYVARVMLANDPFSDLGFKLSVVLLTFSPAFMAAAIYLLLKQITLAFSPELSRLKPKLYTWIFVSCDIVSMVLQGGGGAISAVALTQSLLNIGVDIMIAGLSFQVFTLLVFGLLAGEYSLRIRKSSSLQLRPGSDTLARSKAFQAFLVAMTVAYFCIFIRCCYRVAELSGGWGNHIMSDQAAFIVLDSLMMTIAVILMNVFHPGACFKQAGQQVSDSENMELADGAAEHVRPSKY